MQIYKSGSTRLEELQDQGYTRVTLGVDGNAGFALLGPDLQEGEVEFVEVEMIKDKNQSRCECIAINRAFTKLKKRLGVEQLSYYIGPSHPQHC